MAQPRLQILDVVEICDTIRCFKAEGAELSLAAVMLRLQTFLFVAFVLVLLSDVIHRLRVLDIYVVDHDAGHLLLLGYLGAHSAAVVRALS